MPPEGYYQLGGWKADIELRSNGGNGRDYSNQSLKRLASSIMGSPLICAKDRTLELVLGIKPTGASYLLLTESQTAEYTRYMGIPRPRTRPLESRVFESLSPITFDSVQELEDRLVSLKPKKPGGDTSAANAIYQFGGTEGVARGAFEHNRVLYRLLQGTLDTRKCSLPGDARWAGDLRVLSLIFNLRAMDHRALSDRQRTPSILDLGLAEASGSALDLTEGSAVEHWRVQRNLMLKQGKHVTQAEFSHGESLVLDEAAVGERIRARLDAGSRRPTVLLTMGEDWTNHVLRYLNVQYEAKPLTSLIRDHHSLAEREYRPRHDSFDRGHSRRGDPRRGRSRSKSPRPYSRSSDATPPGSTHYDSRMSRERWNGGIDRRSESSHQPTSPNPRRTPFSSAPNDRSGANSDVPIVYVVDVHALYLTMMREANVDGYQQPSITMLAQRLEVPHPTNEWCAGNEAPLLIKLWKSMISGPSIDHQRDRRCAARDKGANVPAANHATPGIDADTEDPHYWHQPAAAGPTLASIEADDMSDYESDDD